MHRFEYQRLITFAETDVAGIMHFANFFRVMEEAEHAFLRSFGISVHPGQGDGARTGWPRVHASCDFKRPLRFEDIVTVEVLVEEIRGRSVRYIHKFWHGGELCAVGRMTVVCISLDSMKAVELPAAVREKISEAPASEIEASAKGSGMAG